MFSCTYSGSVYPQNRPKLHISTLNTITSCLCQVSLCLNHAIKWYYLTTPQRTGRHRILETWQLLTCMPRAVLPIANCAVFVRSRQSTQFVRTTPCCRWPQITPVYLMNNIINRHRWLTAILLLLLLPFNGHFTSKPRSPSPPVPEQNLWD